MTVAPPPRRYYVIAPGGYAVGYDSTEAAVRVAQEYGEGAHIVDTLATPYHPMAQRIEGGQPVFLEYGAWETRIGEDRNLIEAAKKGCVPIVQAFFAKGGNVNAVDERGATPLIWAVARRSSEIVGVLIAAGADVGVRDANGMTALKLAGQKNLAEIATILRAAGALE